MKERKATFCERHPLFCAAVVAAVCVVLADRHFAWGLGGALLAGWLSIFFGDWRRAILWTACGALAAGVLHFRKSGRDAAEEALLATEGGWHVARLLEDAKDGGRSWSARARLENREGLGGVVVWRALGEPPVAGARVSGRGNFSALAIPRNPGEFDYAGWLKRKGVAAEFRVDGSDGQVETDRWAVWGAKIRHGFRDAVTAGLEPESEEAQIIRAVVIGEHPPDADEMVAAFRNSGTLHVFSVSGLHVSMVATIGWFALRMAGCPRRWAVIVLLPLVFGYSWITGNSPPAVRAAWMAAVFLGAFVFRRRPDPLNALGAVLLATLLWDGRLFFLAGVQLSYGVMAAISLGMTMTSRWFSGIAENDPYLPAEEMGWWRTKGWQLRRWTAQTLAISTAALAGSTPLTLFHFGLVTPVSVLAGMVLIPLVFFMMTAAFVTLPLAWWPAASHGVNRVNGILAIASLKSAEGFSSLPGSHFQWLREREPALIVYDLPYGHGASCLSEGGKGAVLFDCGDRSSFRGVIVPSLRQLGVAPDSVVLSHPDAGHLGGGEQVWKAFPVRQTLLPVTSARGGDYQSWLSEAPRAGVHVLQPRPGDSFDLPDGGRFEMVYRAPEEWTSARADDRVALWRLHWQGWKILFASDAGATVEREALARGLDLSADVLIAGKHRDEPSLGDDFLAAVRPKLVIASHADFPVAERSDPLKVARLRKEGIRVIDQGASGGVTLRASKAELRATGFVDGREVILSH